MEEDVQAKVLRLLDVIALEVVANRGEMREGFRRVDVRFDRVERRLGNVEARMEGVETRIEGVETELRLFRGEFERRIAPLESGGHA